MAINLKFCSVICNNSILSEIPSNHGLPYEARNAKYPILVAPGETLKSRARFTL
jgi:hypothetical protein